MSTREPNPLHAALGLFTTIPVPPIAEVTPRTARRAMTAFPVVGLLLGLPAAAVLALADWLGLPWLGAVLAIAVLAWFTGGLHLDGVADTADGLASRRDAEAALAIMKRSDIGPMGVITLLLVLLGDIAALVGLAGLSGSVLLAPAALVVAATTGRVGVVWGATTGGPTARPGGFGALFADAGSVPTALAHSVALTLLAAALGWLTGGLSAALVLPAAVIAAHVVAHFWQRHLMARLGGHTGDTFGSLVELTQVAVLVTAALGLGLATRL
ncbi:adenosylcobinamide-GDP ribazoletransferase [Propionibacteriaceae bacterium Y1923]